MSLIQTLRISYEATGCFDRLPVSYLNKSLFLRKFYEFEPNLGGIQDRVDTYFNVRLDRPNLVSVLKSQYAKDEIEVSGLVENNINSLLAESTFTVTTGHQLNFFSGPLYVLFKLISTIKLADQLNKSGNGKHFVPVYWMATEDHDIQEINHVTIFGKTIKHESEYHGPSGRMPLQDMELFLAEVESLLGSGTHADELKSVIEASFRSSKNLASAIRKWTHSFLGKYGLVILDANEVSLKRAFAGIMEDELMGQSSFPLVGKTKDELSVEFTPQVNPREVNLFYLHDDSRNRIVPVNDGFEIANTALKFSKAELLEQLHKNPEFFSPNVILRPLYQEVVLPNIAYIGGPAEIAYWLELKAVFDYHHVGFPVLMLRNCALMVDASSTQKIEKLNLTVADFFSSEDLLIRNFISSKGDNSFDINEQADGIAAAFDQIRDHVGSIDPSLRATVESEKQRALNSLKTLEEKVLRSLKKKDETEISQIKKIREKLFPGGSLQERSESFLPLYLKWGSELFDILYREFNPLENQFTVFIESSN